MVVVTEASTTRTFSFPSSLAPDLDEIAKEYGSSSAVFQHLLKLLIDARRATGKTPDATTLRHRVQQAEADYRKARYEEARAEHERCQRVLAEMTAQGPQVEGGVSAESIMVREYARLDHNPKLRLEYLANKHGVALEDLEEAYARHRAQAEAIEREQRARLRARRPAEASP